MAEAERAVCDTLYSFPKLGIESVDGIMKNKLIRIAKIYDNKALLKRVMKLVEK